MQSRLASLAAAAAHVWHWHCHSRNARRRPIHRTSSATSPSSVPRRSSPHDRSFYEGLLSERFAAQGPRRQGARPSRNSSTSELAANRDCDRASASTPSANFSLVEHRKGLAVTSYLLIEGDTARANRTRAKPGIREVYEVAGRQVAPGVDRGRRAADDADRCRTRRAADARSVRAHEFLRRFANHRRRRTSPSRTRAACGARARSASAGIR